MSALLKIPQFPVPFKISQPLSQLNYFTEPTNCIICDMHEIFDIKQAVYNQSFVVSSFIFTETTKSHEFLKKNDKTV